MTIDTLRGAPASSEWSRGSYLRHLGAILTAAVLARLVVAIWGLGEMPLVSDASSYWIYAQGYLREFPGEKAFFWPPGQPLLLTGAAALFGTAAIVAKLTALLTSVTNVLFTSLLAREMLGDDRRLRAAGWIAALYPASVMQSAQPYSQHLTSLALLVVVWALWRAWRRGGFGWYALAGIGLGVGALTRPSVNSVAIALGLLALAALWRGHRPAGGIWRLVAGGGLALALQLLLVTPALLHNHAAGAGYTISTNNERNFFLGNNRYTHFYKTTQLAHKTVSDPTVYDYLKRYEDTANARQVMTSTTVDYILENPGITLVRTLSRFRAFWGFDYVVSREAQNQLGLSDAAMSVGILFEGGGYVLVMLLVIAGLFIARSDLAPGGTPLLLTTALGYQVPYAIVFAMGLYHFPVIWLLMPLAGAALVSILSDQERRRRLVRNIWFWVATLLFLAVQVEYAYWVAKMR